MSCPANLDNGQAGLYVTPDNASIARPSGTRSGPRCLCVRLWRSRSMLPDVWIWHDGSHSHACTQPLHALPDPQFLAQFLSQLVSQLVSQLAPPLPCQYIYFNLKWCFA